MAQSPSKYAHRTMRGVFLIARLDDGRWHTLFNGESLGSYDHPQHAVDDLTMNATLSPGFDTSVLGIPEELFEWQPVAF